MLMLRRVLLLAIAALLYWWVAALGLSTHYVERIGAGDARMASKALTWSDRQPVALLKQAPAVGEKDPDAARALLARAYAENPANAQALTSLAAMAQDEGDAEGAAALLQAAVGMTPADPRTHRRAAQLWAAQGDFDRALQHWSLSIEANPSGKAQIFPILLRLAEDPRTATAFRPLAEAPPAWWEAFFAELAKRSHEVEPVLVFYAWRRESTRAPVTEAERKTYVARLIRDVAVSEAYIEWVNGLGRSERAQLGLLYNGGFELEAANWGFDWHLRSSPTALIDQARIYGMDGQKALHLLFSRHQRRFADAYQPLFLDPGVYRFTGRVRTESLETQGGLKWVLRCLVPESRNLGESERFLGSNEWRDFGFEFEVSESCRMQEIRLESAGKRPFEHKMDGGVWFDRLAIRRISIPTASVDGPQ
jgi:tetratricopeptide (TPR) repeat protein